MKRVAVLLLAMLGVAACTDDEPRPETTKQPRVDYERPAPAWALWRAARAVADERGAAISEEQKRLTSEVWDARGEPAVRQILGGIRSAWRERDPAGYGYLTLHALLRLNSQCNGLGDARERIQREIAFDALTLKDKLRPDDEAGLASMLSSALRGLAWARRSDPKQHDRVIDLRVRIAPHWMRAWSRLEDAVEDDPVVTPPGGFSVQPPAPDEDIPWISGVGPPYLHDATARAAYDEKLEQWIEARTHHREQTRLRRSLAAHSRMLRVDIVRAYRMRPRDEDGLRRLLRESNIPAEDQTSILREVGAQE